jgi:flagellar FliL protein
MAEDGDDEDEESEDDEDGEGEPSKKASRAKLFIIVGAVLFLVIGGVVAAYFMGFLDPLIEMGAEEGEEPPAGEEPAEKAEEAKEEAPAEVADMSNAVFYEMPEMLVNLNVSSKKPKFLKLLFHIALTNAEDVPLVEVRLPHILDNCQSFLRELRVEDLKGSAGMFRLREGVLLRVRASVAPIKVLDVLFKEMLVQ